MIPLKVQGLTKTFSSKTFPIFGKVQTFTAVNDISFQLNKGEILGFLGPNGAGKTTTIQMLLGILTPTKGSIEFFGQDFEKNRSDILKKVTFASSYIKLPGRLTVWENLDVSGMLYSVANPERNERINDLLKFFDLWDIRTRETGMLSAGQMTRLMLAKAFLPDPDIVLLDEPTASLDPDVAQEVRQFILKTRKERGTSILFTSHNMDEVTQVCDRVLVLKSGKIIADDSPLVLASSVSNAHVHLLITSGMDNAIQYAQKENLKFDVKGSDFSFEVEEQSIGNSLIGLAHAGVIYTSVSVDKPTLEDYFLSVAKSSKRGS